MKQHNHHNTKLAGDCDGHKAGVRNEDLIVGFSIDCAVFIVDVKHGLIQVVVFLGLYNDKKMYHQQPCIANYCKNKYAQINAV